MLPITTFIITCGIVGSTAIFLIKCCQYQFAICSASAAFQDAAFLKSIGGVARFHAPLMFMQSEVRGLAVIRHSHLV